MLNITNHQGNTNQNPNEMPLHTYQDNYYFLKREGGQGRESNVSWHEEVLGPLDAVTTTEGH